jgi:hypothetical protein
MPLNVAPSTGPIHIILSLLRGVLGNGFAMISHARESGMKSIVFPSHSSEAIATPARLWRNTLPCRALSLYTPRPPSASLCATQFRQRFPYDLHAREKPGMEKMILVPILHSKA